MGVGRAGATPSVFITHRLSIATLAASWDDGATGDPFWLLGPPGLISASQFQIPGRR